MKLRSTLRACRYSAVLTLSGWLAAASLTLPDGSVYTGDIENGKLHGNGTLVWPNGDALNGTFVDGQIAGQGRLEMARWLL